MSKVLMKVQVGPVQEFIAQARSTRDMWAGSYLLSWLTASAMKVFKDSGVKFIFPTLENQPLYELFCGNFKGDLDAALIPTLPNVFMVLAPQEDADKLAADAKIALKAELQKIADACWGKMRCLGAKDDWKTRWDAQVDAFPVLNWGVVDFDEEKDWSKQVEKLGANFAARRNTRDFDQWKLDENSIGASKDVLSGKEEIIGDEAFWQNKDWKKAGPFGAMNCIKRLFPDAYLEKRASKKAFWGAMSVENTRNIAAGNAEGVSGKDSDGEGIPVNPYMAVIMMDGDRMGAALQKLTTQEEHSDFSKTLARFAENGVNRVLTKFQFEQSTQLVYAGGDDVLVMCPADKALNLAKELRDEFISTMKDYIDPKAKPEEKMDASCGIAVGHYMFPLQRLVQEARAAEHRAKNVRGRAAFAMSMLKRSGEIIHWGGKWENTQGRDKQTALSVYNEFTENVEKEIFSGRFAYALAELLAPYRLIDKNLSIDFKDLKNIIKKEFAHVLERQSLKKGAELSGAVEYLNSLTETQLQDFPNLFLASAFMNRQRGEN